MMEFDFKNQNQEWNLFYFENLDVEPTSKFHLCMEPKTKWKNFDLFF
jgi:hypothetical protein